MHASDIDILTLRRAEPDSFQVRVDANKVRDTGGNRLTDIQVTFQVTFRPTGMATSPGLSCRMRSRNRMTGWCTVGRTVEIGTSIIARIE